MWVQSGMTGATGNLYVGLHEFEEMSFALHILCPGDLFADVGANVGSYTILASAAVGANVIAFEPSDEAFLWLSRNIELNRVSDRVEARREAVGATVGSVSFTSGLDTVNHIDVNGAVSVPITTLDKVCNRVPALIKIDVEGSEADVIRGASATMSNPAVRAVIMELNDSAATKLLESYGFACYSYDPFRRQLASRDDARSGNGIFVRDIERVRPLLRCAPAFSTQGHII
jgi:FkbM family methyltransferase